MQANAIDRASGECSAVGLRRATNRDRDGIVQLHAQGWEIVGISHDPKLDSDLEDVEGSYIARGGEFIVATVDEQVIGMGAFRRLDSRNVEIRRLRVSSRILRQGIGRSILRHLVQEATSRGFKSLVLDATGEMEAARGLFESEGFELERQVEIFGLESYFYRKTLTGIPGSAQL